LGVALLKIEKIENKPAAGEQLENRVPFDAPFRSD